MPDTPTDKAAVPLNQDRANLGYGSPPRSPGSSSRSKRKKIFTPLVLGALGLVLFFLAISFYPWGSTDVFAPLNSNLRLSTTFHVEIVSAVVTQVSSDTSDMRIWAELPAGVAAPPAGSRSATLQVYLPPGTVFGHCSVLICHNGQGAFPSYGFAKLNFHINNDINRTGIAIVDFLIKEHNFGVAYNGISASAAIPEVTYAGPGSPTFFMTYDIPSAASYDWSSFPTGAVNNTSASWTEELTSLVTAERVAVGFNPASQSTHDNETFLAGALIGLAGGAIVAAIQEALHAGD